MPQSVAIVPFADYEQAVPAAVEACGAGPVLERQRRIVIKPNLVNASPPPVTVPVACVAALIHTIRRVSDAEILVAEGPGEVGFDAGRAFRHHGYDALARSGDVRLVDLDRVELSPSRDPHCRVLTNCWLPQVIRESFVISVAVLKAHSLAGVTLSLKNMMGCAPTAHYRQGGAWNKAFFHREMQRSVFELNRHRKPDFSLIDAGVGLASHHLGGPTCDPPVRRILAGLDPVAVDAAGAGLLGVDWREVGHIHEAHGVLGDAERGEAVLESGASVQKVE